MSLVHHLLGPLQLPADVSCNQCYDDHPSIASLQVVSHAWIGNQALLLDLCERTTAHYARLLYLSPTHRRSGGSLLQHWKTRSPQLCVSVILLQAHRLEIESAAAVAVVKCETWHWTVSVLTITLWYSITRPKSVSVNGMTCEMSSTGSALALVGLPRRSPIAPLV